MARRKRTSSGKKSPKPQPRVNQVPPEVAARLAELAGEMRREVYGGKGVPVWGTKFTEIETEGMNLGLEFARLFMEQSVTEQATEVPADALTHEGEAASPLSEPKTAKVQTPAGDVGWEQPRTCLDDSRRAFFPSGEGAGDLH